MSQSAFPFLFIQFQVPAAFLHSVTYQTAHLFMLCSLEHVKKGTHFAEAVMENIVKLNLVMQEFLCY